MTIYVDIYFFINMAADFIIYLTTAVFLGIKVGKLRITLVSVLSALYGTAVLFAAFLGNKICANLYAFISIFILFGKSDIYEYIKRLFVFYGVCVFTSGICSFAAVKSRNLMIMYDNSVFFPADDISFFIALLSAFYASKTIKYFLNKQKLYYKILLRCGLNCVAATAYYDTGNRLCDPVTKQPVIIITQKIADRLKNHEYITLSCSTVSGTDSVRVIHIDEIFFCEEKFSKKDILAGVLLNDDKDFDVLLHQKVHP